MIIKLFIQARMSSSRLPGKMLMEIKGKPILGYVVESVANVSEVGLPIILTSIDSSDDPIVDFCNELNLQCFRGSLNDVAGRFINTIDLTCCDAFVRVCGDSPLIDYRLIDRGIKHFKRGVFDIVTNIHPRTFPSGQSVEVVRSLPFIRAYESMQDIDEFEHVTKCFYNNPENYSICNFISEDDYSVVKLTVDTSDDLKIIEGIINKMTKVHYQYNYFEVIELYDAAKQTGDYL
jgi:spore coat polysaccharide biosynthesis protein SpsF